MLWRAYLFSFALIPGQSTLEVSTENVHCLSGLLLGGPKLWHKLAPGNKIAFGHHPWASVLAALRVDNQFPSLGNSLLMKLCPPAGITSLLHCLVHSVPSSFPPQWNCPIPHFQEEDVLILSHLSSIPTSVLHSMINGGISLHLVSPWELQGATQISVSQIHSELDQALWTCHSICPLGGTGLGPQQKLLLSVLP